MIWLILGLAPIVAVLLHMLFTDPWFLVKFAGLLGVLTGMTLLICYGGWQMNWFNHCGNFWESAYCGG